MALNNQVITQPLVDAVLNVLEANRSAINSVLSRYAKSGGGRLTLGPIYTGRRASRKLQVFPNLAMTVTSRSSEWFHSRGTKDTISLRIFCNVLTADDDTHEKIMNDLTDVIEAVLYQNPIFAFTVIDGENNAEATAVVSTSGVTGDSRGSTDDGFLKSGQIDWAAELFITWRDMNFITNVPGVASPSVLSFDTQPMYASAGTPFLQQPVVYVLDQFGALTSEYNGRLTMSIYTGSGTSGATLSGVDTVSVNNGIAVFSGLSIDKPGEAYTLAVSNTDYTSTLTIEGQSAAFNVSSTATKLVFTADPANGHVAATTPTPLVEIRDDFDNVVTSYAGLVSLVFSDISTDTALMHGTTVATPVNGVATFSDFLIDTVGTYRLKAISGLLDPAESVAFDVAL